MTEPLKVIAPIATPRPISTRDDRQDRAGRIDDAERFGVKEGGAGDQHRGETDQAVERRHQLRHVGHRDFAGDEEADAAADQDRAGDFGQRRDLVRDQRRHHRDGHADHAKAIAAL